MRVLSAILLALAWSASPTLGQQLAEIRRIQGDGAQIWAQRHGGGPPLLVLHGFGAEWRPQQWQHLLAALDGRTLIGVDLRGHGRSDKPHDRAQYGPKVVGDVVAVMDAFGVAEADLVGYSLGGIIALEAARRRPDRIRSVVLIGQGWASPDELAAMADGAASLMQVDTATLAPRDRESFRRNDVEALVALARSYPELGAAAEEIAAITPPILAVVGSDDPRMARVEALAEVRPSTRVRTLEGRDHGSILDDSAYARAIADFLGQVSPTQATQPDEMPAGGADGPAADALLDGLFRFLDAMHRKDADAMREALIPETRFTLIRARDGGAPSPWVLTGEEFIQAVTDPAITPLEERLGPPRVQIQGSLAAVWAHYQVFAGGKLSHCGTDAFQFAWLDGGWKLLALADTPPRTECGAPFAPNPRR